MLLLFALALRRRALGGTVARAKAVEAYHFFLDVLDHSGERLLVKRLDVEREIVARGEGGAVIADEGD